MGPRPFSAAGSGGKRDEWYTTGTMVEAGLGVARQPAPRPLASRTAARSPFRPDRNRMMGASMLSPGLPAGRDPSRGLYKIGRKRCNIKLGNFRRKDTLNGLARAVCGPAAGVRRASDPPRRGSQWGTCSPNGRMDRSKRADRNRPATPATKASSTSIIERWVVDRFSGRACGTSANPKGGKSGPQSFYSQAGYSHGASSCRPHRTSPVRAEPRSICQRVGKPNADDPRSAQQLGRNLRDQEQEKFTSEFEQTLLATNRFLEAARQHVPFLMRKAERIEDYLRQR